MKFSYTFAGSVLNRQYIAITPRYVDENNQLRIEIHPHEIRIITKVDANNDGTLEVDIVHVVAHASATEVCK